MLLADKGIVFHHLNYSETSIIVKVFTREHGLISVLKKGAKRKGSKSSSAAHQPLSIVSVEYYFSDSKDLHTAKSLELMTPYRSLHNEIYKASVMMFLNEMLYKSIQHQEKNEELFDFIEGFLITMDLQEFNPNAHLWFLAHLTIPLGIQPDIDGYKEGLVLDLLEGDFKFNTGRKGDSTVISAQGIAKLLGTKFEDISYLNLTSGGRRDVLQTLVDYYQLQLEGIKSINSHLVLKELLE